MNSNRIAVIDVETTGLSPWRHDRVVEIAIVVIEPNGSPVLEYETLLNPRRDVGPSRIHGISASDVLRAPCFEDVAGDLLEILAGTDLVAGHNVAFDKNFLIKEFERAGVQLPEFPSLCTCSLFGRANLRRCCEELGIELTGQPHRALTDARAAARIVSILYSGDPSLLDTRVLNAIDWPKVPPLGTTPFPREHVHREAIRAPSFLERIASCTRHDVEAEAPSVLAYMVLIDRILEDRLIDEKEEATLIDAAVHWNLSPRQLTGAHAHYMHNLVVAALSDGVISDAELRDLHIVARLLGQDLSALDALIDSTKSQLAAARGLAPSRTSGRHEFVGKTICFTGTLNATINGRPIERDLAESLAAGAGVRVASNVSKKLDALIVADPSTQSGKAKKAREYGIRIIAEAVFWKSVGVCVD
ncbi:MAG: exonuclease domain-containing protein [Isosphaeraceae bacterium]|nr:exonuclease domain-containing protein [Isosphaeraceae bacterium]